MRTALNGILVLVLLLVGFQAVSASSKKSTLEERVTALESRIEDLEVTLLSNLLGDCSNEVHLKRLYGIPPMTFSECREDRDYLYGLYLENPPSEDVDPKDAERG